VIGKVDVRGSLGMDAHTPVGFQSIECNAHVVTSDDTTPEMLERLVTMSERSCINLATLRNGTRVTSGIKLAKAAPSRLNL
jgi:hypothetical protein